MENKNLVKISVAGIFAVAAFATSSLMAPSEAEAQVDGTGYRNLDMNAWSCGGSGGNCLPTVEVVPEG